MTPTVHATCVVIGETGVLVRGPSGSGKTTLALALLDRVRHDGGFAALVADDRVALLPASGRLIARPPETLAGLAEQRGLGIVALPHEAGAVLGLVVDLLAEDGVERMPELGGTRAEVEGCALPGSRPRNGPSPSPCRS